MQTDNQLLLGIYRLKPLPQNIHAIISLPNDSCGESTLSFVQQKESRLERFSFKILTVKKPFDFAQGKLIW